MLTQLKNTQEENMQAVNTTKQNTQSGIISLYLVASRALHDYSRPDSQWRHRQHSYNHPLWTGKLGVHAQDDVLFVRDALEDLMHTLRTQQDFLLLRILVNVLPLSIQLQARASDTWLVAPTATVALQRSNSGDGGKNVRKKCVYR